MSNPVACPRLVGVPEPQIKISDRAWVPIPHLALFTQDQDARKVVKVLKNSHVVRCVIDGPPPPAHELPKVRALRIEKLVQTASQLRSYIDDDSEALLDGCVLLVAGIAQLFGEVCRILVPEHTWRWSTRENGLGPLWETRFGGKICQWGVTGSKGPVLVLF